MHHFLVTNLNSNLGEDTFKKDIQIVLINIKLFRTMQLFKFNVIIKLKVNSI